MMVDLVTPLLQWLNTHPNSAGFATFLISMGESLAIIGTIVPGSVTMTAIGALAGAGVIPFWSTIIWGILGAIVGDNGSFWLGHHFTRRLPTMWPFRRHPQLLHKGENFFRQYGIMSVFIGRFIGPVRALVPLVAGMLGMQPLRYIPVSVIASMLWAPVYMLPGILLGAASLELPPDVAVHALLILLLVALFFVICFWMIVKILLLVRNQIDAGLNWVWQKLLNSRYFHFWTTLLKHHDKQETHGQLTLAFYFILACLLFACLASYVFFHGSQSIVANKVFFYTFRSFRSSTVDNIMLFMTLLGDKRILIPATLAIFGWLAYKKNWHTAWHVLALLLLTCASIFIFKHVVHSPRPWGIANSPETFSFPSGHATLSTMFYAGLGLLLIYTSKIKRRWPFYFLIIFIIGTISTSRLYLGAHWFTDVVAGWIVASAVLMAVILSFKRHYEKPVPVRSVFLVAILAIALMVSFTSIRHFETLKSDYAKLDWPSSSISLTTWWDHNDDNLPLLRVGRVGLDAEMFNIQWVGDLSQIQNTLLSQGWEIPPETTWINVLHRVTDVSSAEHLPLVAPLYLDKKPALILVKHVNGDKKLVVLRLWQSNITVANTSQPLWLGSVGGVPRTYSWLINYKRGNHVDVDTHLIFASLPNQYDIKSLTMTVKKNHHWKQEEMILIKPKNL